MKLKSEIISPVTNMPMVALLAAHRQDQTSESIHYRAAIMGQRKLGYSQMIGMTGCDGDGQ